MSLKFCILSPDKSNTVEGVVGNVLSGLNIVGSYEEADVVLVPISRFHHFRINPQIGPLDKKWVLIDFIEYGANEWDRKNTHLFGQNKLRDFDTFNDSNLSIEDWEAFDKWVEENPPLLTFKRELLAKDVSDRVKPIEYACVLPPPPPERREQFNHRPVEVFSSWGFSNETRKRVHGEIFKQSSHLGYHPVSDWSHIERATQENQRVWVSICVPHYARVPIGNVLAWNGRSKLSLSLPGAGIKCFRHIESSVNSVMVLQDDPLAWTFPWVHGENCIRVTKNNPTDMRVIQGLEGDEEVLAMDEALKRDDLYDIYLKGLENIDRYRTKRYAQEYLVPEIQKALDASK